MGEDVELGSYGSKWRHGWIPLNPAATALKLKQLKAGGSHKTEVRAPHTIVVAPNHRGGFGALVTHEDGNSHYLEHESKGGALKMARSHAYRQQSKAAATQRVQQAAQERTRRIMARNTLRDEAAAKKLPTGYRVSSDRFGLALHHNGKMIRTSSDMQLLTKYAQDHAKGDVSAHPKSVNDEIKSRAEVRAAKVSKVSEIKAKASERVPEGFTDTASNGKQYDHNAITGLVHRRDGAQVGTMHQNADGSWKIEGVGGNLPSHTVKTRSQAINGLALAHDMHLKDSAAKKAKAEADKASAKNAMDASAAQSRELETAALRVLATRTQGYPKNRYTASRNIISQASGSTHEERLASIKAQVQKYKPAELQRETLFQLPVKAPSKPRSVTQDTERMQRARAELERRTGSVASLDGTPDAATLDSIREGMPVTHGGRSGHVIARYGQTFDTYHPPTEGKNGFYMRHEIRVRRGKKHLVSEFAGHSEAKAS